MEYRSEIKEDIIIKNSTNIREYKLIENIFVFQRRNLRRAAAPETQKIKP